MFGQKIFLTIVIRVDGGSLDRRVRKVERERGIYTSDAVYQKEGNLIIDAYTAGDTNYVGSLRTSYSWQFGYFEARIKFQTESGIHQAFWMMPEGVNHGSEGGSCPDIYGAEIDIVEHRARDQDFNWIANHYWSANHWGGYGSNHKSKGKLNKNKTSNGDWHIYGVQWNGCMYKFFIDNVYVGHKIVEGVSATPEYIILSNNVGVGWAGPVRNYGPKNSNRSRMLVDWVRVWQK